MCNDYRMKGAPRDIGDVFAHLKIPLRFESGSIPNIEPREDIRISDRAPLVMAADGGAELKILPWSWKTPQGRPVFNFRSEHRRFDHGRCLILADGFYEFTGSASPKTKWLFTLKDTPLFAIAGYVKNDAFAMLTTAPGPDVAPYHDRQVIPLAPTSWADWLSHARNEAELLRPLPPGSLEVAQVQA